LNMPAKKTGRRPSSPSSRGTRGRESSLDGREELVTTFRRIIKEADPEAVEEVKWRKPSNPEGVPVWSHDGLVCHVVKLKGRVRLTLWHGALLPDPKHLYNACLESSSMRAIDIHEGDEPDEAAIRELVRGVVALNRSRARG
jgi:hypothetical protein